MTDSKFRIVITAVDQATAVVQNVKTAIGKVTAPIADLSSAVASVAKETGLEKVGKTLLDVGNAASEAATKMGGLSLPAVFGGGLSVAAIGRAAYAWGEYGTQLKNTAYAADVSTDYLQELQGAAKRAGVSTESVVNDVKQLSWLTHAKATNLLIDPSITTALNQMNVSLSGDTTTNIERIVNAISHLPDANSKTHMMTVLGMSPESLALWKDGMAGVNEQIQQYKGTGALVDKKDIENAHAFYQSLINIGDAIVGVGEKAAAHAVYLTQFLNSAAKQISGSEHGPTLKDAWNDVISGLGDNDLKAMGPKKEFVAKKGIDAWKDLFSEMPFVRDSDNSSNSPGRGPSSTSAGIKIDGAAPPVNILAPPRMSDVEDAATRMSAPIQMEVLLRGAPPGTEATVRGGPGVNPTVRIEHSMQTTVGP